MSPQGDYILDHDQKLRWIVIPKCASSSLDRMLIPDGKWRLHRAYAMAHDEYYTVVFVRHPFQRVASALHTVLRTHPRFDIRMKDHILDKMAKPETMDVHVRPQTWYTDGFRLDYVGTLETMPTHWKRLRRRFVLPDLKWDNKSGRKDWHKEPFDWDTLREFYAGDFALYEGAK